MTYEAEPNDADAESLRKEPWFQNAPEWLGEVLVILTRTRNENRKMAALLDDRSKLLIRAEESVQNQAIILGDQQRSLIKAVEDLRKFSNTIYGPDSALAQINNKLDAIQKSQRDDQQQTSSKFTSLDERIAKLEEQVAQLQKNSAA